MCIYFGKYNTSSMLVTLKQRERVLNTLIHL